MPKTHASAYSVGAILEQQHSNECPVVSCASKCLDAHEKNYQFSEKDLFAIVSACKKFGNYLSGKKFVIVTGHTALQFLNI